MAPPQKVKATEAELKAFDWLPLEQWSVDTIFNYYGVNAKKLCKICDKWVSVGDLSEHVKKHKKARIDLKKKEAEEARRLGREKAAETKRLRKEERDRKE